MSEDVTIEREREIRKRNRKLRRENAALRAAAAYLLRVGAIDPDVPPNSIYREANKGSIHGHHVRVVAAEREWDAHMKVLRGRDEHE